MKSAVTFFIILAFAATPADSLAHSGPQDSNGCHELSISETKGGGVTETTSTGTHCHPKKDSKSILASIGAVVGVVFVLAAINGLLERNKTALPEEAENLNLQPKFTEDAELEGVRLEYKYEF